MAMSLDMYSTLTSAFFGITRFISLSILLCMILYHVLLVTGAVRKVVSG